MSSQPQSLRHRGKKGHAHVKEDQNGSVNIADKVSSEVKSTFTREWDHKVALTVLSILAIITRFYGISHPNEVVFDEVHFGKFASYYLQRTYFFDVHPPFGKLLFALAGWFVGYDGKFLFENIGDSYITNKVPYIAYRAVPALTGSLTVATVYLIMWESGYSVPACILATVLVLFDNAHVNQTRLILLDATLVLAMALSILCYVKFYKMRHAPFTRKWWKWLLATGLALSCTISTKYVGAFTFFSIGVPVTIDLWDLLDVKRRRGALTAKEFGRHFGARVIGLIIVPFLMYLFWFQVHFLILSRSGPGDQFMSPQFQATLGDNLMLSQSVGVQYLDVVTMRHKDTQVYLHSHLEYYPLRYDDGRISSQGQQVTGYPHNDTNNEWQIIPVRDMANPNATPLRNGQLIRLRHTGTDSYLRSHDVASPWYPTNQEFTTVKYEDALKDAFNDTLFEVRVDRVNEGTEIRTKASQFRLIHYPSRIAMWTQSETPLPEWGFKQAEVNGNKNVKDMSNLWYFEHIPSIPEGSPRLVYQPRKIESVPFISKWLELQGLMFYHNNALTGGHPYASHPVQWPFLLSGVSFWTKQDTREQIYFLGNPMGWWLTASLLAVFAGLLGADQVSLRRGVDSLDGRTRIRLYNSTGFFFLVWAAHYLPFYVMGRQLFLHHYLPAHVASCLIAGALLEFIFNIESSSSSGSVADAFNSRSSATLTTEGSSPTKAKASGTAAKSRPIRERIGSQNLTATWIALAVITVVIITGFFFFAPLTYGFPSLSIEQVKARRWFGWELHFAK